MKSPTAVFDMLAIVGGLNIPLDWNLIMPDGSECANHDMPKLPVAIRHFGVAQAYDRFIVLCGGQDNTDALSKFFETDKIEMKKDIKKLYNTHIKRIYIRI
jgi:hypothetical protein